MISFVIFVEREDAAVDRLRELRQIEDYLQAEVILTDLTPGHELEKWRSLRNVQIIHPRIADGQPIYGELLEEIRGRIAPENRWYLTTDRFGITENNIRLLDSAISEDAAVAAAGGSLEEPSSDRQSSNDRKHITTKVLSLDSEVIGLSGSAVTEIGGFDRQLRAKGSVFKDLFLRIIQSEKYYLKMCGEAVFSAVYPLKEAVNDDDQGDRLLLKDKWGFYYLNLKGNSNIIDNILPNSSPVMRVLEIGCDLGATLYEIKEKFPNAECYGCDINPAAVAFASHFANVCVCDVEKKEFPWEKDYFDCIVFGDVLEHLRDPEGVLRALRGYLKSDGYVLASIPNLMHISVIEDLLRGNFTYSEVGLLDKTHIHLFTFNEIAKMMANAGYQISAIAAVAPPVSKEQRWLIDELLKLNKGAAEYMYLAFQYLLRAGVGGAPEESEQNEEK